MYFAIYVPYVISGVASFVLRAHRDTHNVTIIHMITNLYSHSKQTIGSLSEDIAHTKVVVLAQYRI